jgi:GT2 family glycosyltransferase
VKLIRNEHNRGFAAANNSGIKQSHARYVILLNPDTLLGDDALSALVHWMDAHPDVGAAGPCLMQVNGEVQPYSFGDAPTPVYLGRRLWSHLRGAYLHRWQGDQPQTAAWVAGTCMIVRREALEQVGPLDERFFLYFEDVDWGLRFRSLGWRVMYLPSIVITHVGGASVGPDAIKHYDRSFVHLYRKHYGAVAGFGMWLALRIYRRLQQVRSRQRAATNA